MVKRAEFQEVYFNIQSGTQLIGKLAVEAEIEAGAYETDIYSLPELLTGQERVVGPEDFYEGRIIYTSLEKYDALRQEYKLLRQNSEKSEDDKKKIVAFEKLWDPAFDVPIARWLDKRAYQHPKDGALSIEIIRRAGFLNLIPRENYFRNRKGGTVGLYKDALLENTRTRTLFDRWTTEDYVNYIRKLARKIGDKPTTDDIDKAARKVRNPSEKQISRRFGSCSVLFELAGYFETKLHSRSDIIGWGVRFMEANEGKLPTAPAMRLLSARHRGPHDDIVYKHDYFSSMYDFQTECFIAYERKVQNRKSIREAQLVEIDQMLPHDSITQRLVKHSSGEDDLVRMHAKYKLIREFVGAKLTQEITKTCRAKSASGMVILILNNTEDITAGDIEAQAEILGLYDTIWPLNGYLQDLKVA